jgi:hypothetical protein
MRDEAPAVLPGHRRSERGVSLLETVVALSVLLVGALGILPLGLVAVSTTESEGHLVARATEYSQDKMEQLLALAYADSTTDTRVFPAPISGGTGLGGSLAVGAVVGSSNPAAPVAGYVDYLTATGDTYPVTAMLGTTAPAGWFYKRVWKIECPTGTTGIKQVTVTTIVARRVGGFGIVPRATMVALKTFPF